MGYLLQEHVLQSQLWPARVRPAVLAPPVQSYSKAGFLHQSQHSAARAYQMDEERRKTKLEPALSTLTEPCHPQPHSLGLGLLQSWERTLMLGSWGSYPESTGQNWNDPNTGTWAHTLSPAIITQQCTARYLKGQGHRNGTPGVGRQGALCWSVNNGLVCMVFYAALLT